MARVARTRQGATHRNTLVLPRTSHISCSCTATQEPCRSRIEPTESKSSNWAYWRALPMGNGLITHWPVPPGDDLLDLPGSETIARLALRAHASASHRAPDLTSGRFPALPGGQFRHVATYDRRGGPSGFRRGRRQLGNTRCPNFTQHSHQESWTARTKR